MYWKQTNKQVQLSQAALNICDLKPSQEVPAMMSGSKPIKVEQI